MRVTTRATSLGLVAALVFSGPLVTAGPVEDAYVAGYATAVLERQLTLTATKVTVKDGVVTIEAQGIAASDREKVVAAVSRISGVLRVELVEAVSPGAPTIALPPAVKRTPTPTGPAVEADVPGRGVVKVLPEGSLFAPLIADPRWPHFAVVHQWFLNDRQLGNVVAVSLGDTFAFLRGDVPFGGQWDLGLQAGIFSIFDLDAPSSDLVNTDYIVAIPVGYRAGPLSALARVFHQSSHLGDEFLLRNRVERINLSFEAVDLRLSYEVAPWLRIYAGAGYLVRRDPPELEPWSTQFGAEVRSSWTFVGLRPIAAVDIQQREQNGWGADLSLRAGVQIESLPIFNRKLQIMLEYFSGHSPNGQFYRERIEYLGVGMHLLF